MRVQSVFTYYCTRYKSKHLSLYVCIERKIERGVFTVFNFTRDPSYPRPNAAHNLQ